MKPSSFLLIFSLLAGCATKPTPYQKEKKKEGFSDLSREDFKVSVFRANSKTKKDRVELFAQFRAIENCYEKSLHTNVIAVLDQTIEKQVTRSTGGGWGPSYGFGMYPYYGSSFGFGANFNTISADSWREVLEFPIIEVYYRCSEIIYRPLVKFRELSADQIKHLVKDVKGGLQIEEMLSHSPNAETFQNGDILLKANGKRLERIYDLTKLFAPGSQTVNVEFLREGERFSRVMKSKNVTEESKIHEEEILKRVCSMKGDHREELLRERKWCRSI